MPRSPLPALFLALAALAGGCDKKTDPARGPTDKDQLQGVWAVESVECGVELTAPERKQLTDSRLHVQSDRFALGAGDEWAFYTFVVDAGKEPRGLILSESDPEGKPLGPTGGIPRPARAKGAVYKLDGDKLALAFLRTSDSASVPPPADLKAEPGQNVVLLRFTKTAEEPRTKWDVPAKPAGKKK